MVGVERHAGAIGTTDINTLLPCAWRAALSFLSMALIVTRSTERAGVRQHQREMWVCAAGQDVIDAGLALATDIGAALDAAPTVAPQREQPQSAPFLRPQERHGRA